METKIIHHLTQNSVVSFVNLPPYLSCLLSHIPDHSEYPDGHMSPMWSTSLPYTPMKAEAERETWRLRILNVSCMPRIWVLCTVHSIINHLFTMYLDNRNKCFSTQPLWMALLTYVLPWVILVCAIDTVLLWCATVCFYICVLYELFQLNIIHLGSVWYQFCFYSLLLFKIKWLKLEPELEPVVHPSPVQHQYFSDGS